MNYEISGVYPQVDFGPDALMGMRGVAGDINMALDTLIEKQVVEFKKWMSEINSPAFGKSILEIKYETNIANGSLFSFRIHLFSSPAGAAHPYNYDVSFNYCPVSVGLLKISDLFLPNSGYLQYISNKCVLSLRNKAKSDEIKNSDDMIMNGAAADTANFKVFSITKDYLIIIFNPAQVLPSYAGIQTVLIPFSGMKGMIDTKGQLEGK